MGPQKNMAKYYLLLLLWLWLLLFIVIMIIIGTILFYLDVF